MAKATKMAVKSSAKSAKSTSSSVSKGSLGTIGDLRSKYRSGTSSGFSSGSTDPSDSDGSSGISSSRYQNPYKSSGMQINSIPVQYWLPKYPITVSLSFFVKRLRHYRVYIIVLMVDHTIFENPMIFRGSKYMLDVYD